MFFYLLFLCKIVFKNLISFLLFPLYISVSIQFRPKPGRTTSEVQSVLSNVEYEIPKRLRRLSSGNVETSSSASYDIVPGNDNSAPATDPAASSNDGTTTPSSETSPLSSDGTKSKNSDNILLVVGVVILGVIVVGLGVAVFMMTHSQKKLKKKNKRLTTKNRRLSLHAVSDADEYENNLTTETKFSTVNPIFRSSKC